MQDTLFIQSVYYVFVLLYGMCVAELGYFMYDWLKMFETALLNVFSGAVFDMKKILYFYNYIKLITIRINYKYSIFL